MGDESKYQPWDRRAHSPSAVPTPRPPLSGRDMERARETKSLVHQHMPEAIPMIRELANLGMIDGWRSVTFITKEENGNF
ncbi:hypothetical protein [Herbaspirillum huttiense]|uniref:Uncharacterized protein n=2 Tax=Herbaspirillum huttiense TaxID=863372 RepID=A0AAJ2LTH0_9BURK|nr:hypothetical protein [Herbaspirillum huttiense]MDR9834871.1 hypothetical protein [Herbaspirillum huttiense]